MDFSARLAALMDQDKITAEQLAAEVGVSHVAVHYWLIGRNRPSRKRLQELAKFFNVSVAFLLTGAHGNVTTPPVADDRFRLNQRLPLDVPILGSERANRGGAFRMTGRIGAAARTPGCSADTYALLMDGVSMDPWRAPGSLIYVSPARPARVGSHAVVTVVDDVSGAEMSLVAKLVQRTQKRVRLEQYNPRAQFDLPRETVRSIHRVLEWDELLEAA